MAMKDLSADVVSELSLLEKAALLSGENIWQSREIPRLGIPAVFLADGPHGVRKQVGSSDHLGLNASLPATCFPTAATVANSWDTELAERLGRALGTEAAGLDVDVLLGPGLNMKRSPLCGRNFEYFSEDPYLAGKMAAGYVRGIQSQSVIACPKHFAVNNQETMRMANDSIVDERTLREIYLTAFEIVVRESAPGSIMSSYNLVNGVYANENAHLLRTILRDEWGFDGAVVTDWGGGNDSVSAVRNGGTLEMPTPGFDSVRQIMDAVERGDLSEADLDARVGEMLGLAATAAQRKSGTTVDHGAHHDLARRAAEESLVLLKNEGDLLPLTDQQAVALIGDFALKPRFQGAGSSVVNQTQLETTVQSIAASGLAMSAFAQGYRRGGESDDALVREAVDLARQAEVVLLYLGLDEISETEGLDRVRIRLPDNQVELLNRLAEVNDNIAVVLSAGSVVEMPWLHQCKALVHGYLSGQAGATAMLNAIAGRVNPSGKLAETYPIRLEDTPTFHYFPGAGKHTEYREGPFIGYRYYETVAKPVLFPFGYGMSYTTFAYANLVATAQGVTFDVTNTGARAGAEVAQLYVGGGSMVPKPIKELKGFVKVPLSAGETKAVTIPLDDKAFRFFDVETDSWQIETGDYRLMVGASVADIRLEATIPVMGTITRESEQSTLAERLPHYFSGAVQQIPDAEFEALLGREIPLDSQDGELELNDALAQMQRARSPLARVAFRVLNNLKKRSEDKGTPDLNILFVFGMPFRAIAKMTNGMVSMEMAESLVRMVNSRFLGGLGSLIAGYVRNRRQNRDLANRLRP